MFELQPRDVGAGSGQVQSKDERMKQILDEIMEKLPEEFAMHELVAKVPAEERTPYTVVAFQECERMNALTGEIRRSLKELNLGLKGTQWTTRLLEHRTHLTVAPLEPTEPRTLSFHRTEPELY